MSSLEALTQNDPCAESEIKLELIPISVSHIVR